MFVNNTGVYLAIFTVLSSSVLRLVDDSKIVCFSGKTVDLVCLTVKCAPAGVLVNHGCSIVKGALLGANGHWTGVDDGIMAPPRLVSLYKNQVANPAKRDQWHAELNLAVDVSDHSTGLKSTSSSILVKGSTIGIWRGLYDKVSNHCDVSRVAHMYSY